MLDNNDDDDGDDDDKEGIVTWTRTSWTHKTYTLLKYAHLSVVYHVWIKEKKNYMAWKVGFLNENKALFPFVCQFN